MRNGTWNIERKVFQVLNKISHITDKGNSIVDEDILFHWEQVTSP